MGGNAEQLEAEHIYQWRKILQWNTCKYIKKKNNIGKHMVFTAADKKQ